MKVTLELTEREINDLTVLNPVYRVLTLRGNRYRIKMEAIERMS